MALNPLVTVIIPSYNHDRYVTQAIKSVLSQSYKNIELIVIDDGSEDLSVKKILKLKNSFSFKFIKRKNRGLANTLNEALNLSKGFYIAFLASDDYYLPKRIEHAVNQLNRLSKEFVAVYTDGYMINANNRKLCKFSDIYPRPILGSVYKNLLCCNWIPAMGVTYRASIFKKNKYDNRFMIEDWSLNLRIFKNRSYKIQFYKSLDFCYRQHDRNISKEDHLMKEQFNLMQLYFRDLGNFHQFKQQLKMKRFAIWKKLNITNINLLFLSSLRILQRIYINFKAPFFW